MFQWQTPGLSLYGEEFEFFSQHKLHPAVQLDETQMSTLHEGGENTEHETKAFCRNVFVCLTSTKIDKTALATAMSKSLILQSIGIHTIWTERETHSQHTPSLQLV